MLIVFLQTLFSNIAIITKHRKLMDMFLFINLNVLGKYALNRCWWNY
jgi:hypothetical protein